MQQNLRPRLSANPCDPSTCMHVPVADTSAMDPLDQQISEVCLLQNRLSGQLPASMSAFKLRALDLNWNDLQGGRAPCLPAALGISATSNSRPFGCIIPRLGGQLPACLAKLSPYTLKLHSCNFTGALSPMAFYSISCMATTRSLVPFKPRLCPAVRPASKLV